MADLSFKIEAAIASTQRGSKSCTNVGDALEEIVGKVTEADVLVAEIASAAKEQAQGIRQVGVAMTQMDKVTQGNASSAEQTSSAAEELNSQAKLLQENVEQLQELIASTSRSGDDEANARRPPRAVAQRPVSRSKGISRGRHDGADSSVADARRREASIVMPDERNVADGDDVNFRNF